MKMVNKVLHTAGAYDKMRQNRKRTVVQIDTFEEAILWIEDSTQKEGSIKFNAFGTSIMRFVGWQFLA